MPLIIFIFLIYGAYQSYVLQRNDYESHIAARLEAGCKSIIVDDFEGHASRAFKVSTESRFNLQNDLNDIIVYVESELYFSDTAPQAILCMAHIPFSYNGLSENTNVTFSFHRPLYAPKNYHFLWANNGTFNLTIKQVEELRFSPYPLFSLEKPEYGFFNFYLRKLE